MEDVNTDFTVGDDDKLENRQLRFVGGSFISSSIMETLPESIQHKLGEGEWGWDDLPTRDDATSWRDVETGCRLTKQELSRVKNARCPGR